MNNESDLDLLRNVRLPSAPRERSDQSGESDVQFCQVQEFHNMWSPDKHLRYGTDYGRCSECIAGKGAKSL